MLKVLRPGVRHPDVVMWEEFLLGYGFCNTEVDEHFNSDSVKSTEFFQDAYSLKIDGWVGTNTWKKAIELGLDIYEDDTSEQDGPNWPALPLDLEPIVGTAARMQVWGEMTYKSSPTSGNPEGIAITNNWSDNNIVAVDTPLLDSVKGMRYRDRLQGGGPSKVTIHRLVEESFLALWHAWQDEGLLDRIITWAGMWNPRYIRGSRTSLSNHAFATAFDINAPWNGLRRVPSLFGEKGCVRELVTVANDFGWYWGGHFSRRDGMHFEATEKAIGS